MQDSMSTQQEHVNTICLDFGQITNCVSTQVNRKCLRHKDLLTKEKLWNILAATDKNIGDNEDASENLRRSDRRRIERTRQRTGKAAWSFFGMRKTTGEHTNKDVHNRWH